MPFEKRTMDFILSDKTNPKIIIENSFLVTTSSGQGDKSKTEGNINKLIKNIIPRQNLRPLQGNKRLDIKKGDTKRLFYLKR